MDDECVKCGRYSGGASLCLECEKSALKRNAKKPRRKKLDPLCREMLAALIKVGIGRPPSEQELAVLIEKVQERFIV